MPLFALSRSRFFLVSSIPFIRSDDSRIFVPHGHHNPHAHTIPSQALFSSLQSIHLHPFRFNTTLRTYPENSTCLILSHAQVIQYLSFPPTPTIFIHSDPNPKKAVLKEKSLPFPVFRRLFVAWPHRSCPRSPRHALRPGGVHGLYYILRSSSLPFRASIPRRIPYLDLLLFIKWTTYFSPHCLSR
jgi:hypothetical protein